MPPISSNAHYNSTDKLQNALAAYTEPIIQKNGGIQFGNLEEGQVVKFVRKKNSDKQANL